MIKSSTEIGVVGFGVGEGAGTITFGVGVGAGVGFETIIRGRSVVGDGCWENMTVVEITKMMNPKKMFDFIIFLEFIDLLSETSESLRKAQILETRRNKDSRIR